MQKKKFFIALPIIAMLLFFIGTAAWAAGSINFQSVIKAKVVDFSASDNGTVLAIVENEDNGLTLYRSTDIGKTWEKVKWLVDNVYLEEGDIAGINDIAFLPNGTILISGSLKSGSSLFIKSTDGGKRWESINADSAPLNIEPAGSDLLGVFKIPRQDLTMLKISHDGGKTWSELRSSVADYDGSLIALDAKTWVVVSQNGGIDVTFDGGKTWQNVGIKLAGVSANRYEPGVPVKMIWGKVAGVVEPDGSKTLAACGPGARGQVYLSHDLTKWNRIDESCFEWRKNWTASRVICIAVVQNGILLAGTPDDCVLVSSDGGNTWMPVTQGVDGEIKKIKSFTSEGKLIVLMLQENELVRSEIPLSILTQKGTQSSETMPSQPESIPVIKFIVGSKSYFVGDKAFEMDAAPFIENGRTFVPVRFLAYALGVPESGIVWSPSTKTVSLRKDNVLIEMSVGGNIIYVNGQGHQMDVSPMIRNERTYLPARFVAEAFGYEVSWDPTTTTVFVQPKNNK